MQNIQVNMQFNADTSNAQSQIQQLQNTLKSIATTHVNVQGGSIDQAVQSAQLLSQHLAAATNVNTGKLDFTKLQTSLKAANTDLTTLTNNLLAMGPKGQQAFSQVANAVAHAELSVKKTNAALAAFGTTLMNTIKWQAASTLIHGAMSAFSSAVGHIEKLDSALNKIQIVTGKTASEMASFAKQSQELSRALSSTTEEYAKASLIFFQQGLGEKEVLERTEATIKMAKVTGDAVQTVSDQLTAIWNNFDDGTQSLEHYVDVITALGAATASSTSEISDGLQKFAAIAETVGLSYEYAATALATVTAETRQSADVVGTAFKTLFARMEGLKLGETLDDGTTLNQYSQAMAKAGINIKDANGNLKDMDVILDEMGTKWQTLNKDQQVALAQQVGGIRQYNQLIALMDNWDTFKINLEIAEDSKGTLEKQFDAYQTSIEASKKALQNAKETLYETLFNSKALSEFNNTLTSILEVITRVVDKAGGLKGLLEFGGLLLLNTLLPKLEVFIARIGTSIANITGAAKYSQINMLDKQVQQERANAGMAPQEKTGFSVKAQIKPTTLGAKESDVESIQKVDPTGSATTMATQSAQEYAGINAIILGIKKEHLIIEDQMTAKQKEQYNNYLDQINAENDLLRIAREKQQLNKQNADQSSEKAQAALRGVATDEQIQETQNNEINKQLKESGATKKKAEADQRYQNELDALAKEKEQIDKLKGEINDGNLGRKSKAKRQEQVKQRTANYEKRKQQAESNHKAANKEYEREKTDAEDRVISDPDIVKKVDFHGEKTSTLSQSLQAEIDRKTVVRNVVEPQQESSVTGAVASTMQGMKSELATDQSGNIATSQENLEKLGALQSQYNTDSQKAVDLQTELNMALETGVTSAKKGTQQYESGNKVLQSAQKFAQQYKNQIGAAADEMEASGKYSKETIQTVRDLAKEGSKVNLEGMTPEKLQGIQTAIGKVETGLKKAGATAGNMANGMADDLAKVSNTSKDTFTNASNGAKDLAQSGNDIEAILERLIAKLTQKPPVQPDPFGQLRAGIQTSVQMMTGLAMGANMLSNGLKNAFDPDATGIEQLMGAMMILQGVQSLLNASTAAYKVILFAVNLVMSIGAGIKKLFIAETWKNIGATIKDTIATTANAVASVFAAEAKKGLAGVIAGVLAAALIVGTVLMVGLTLAEEKETEQAQQEADMKKQQAENAREAAQAAREEMDAVNELTQAYMDALRVYEQTGESKEDLKKAAFEAVDAMGIEGREADILAGRYADLTKEILAYNAAKSGDAVTASEGSIAASGSAFLSKEAVDGDTGMTTVTSNGKSYLAMRLGDSGKDEVLLHRWLETNDSPWFMDDNYLKAEYSNPQDVSYLMSEFNKLHQGVSAMATQEDMDEMEFFDRVQEMKDSGSWDVGQDAAGAYETHADTTIAAAKAEFLPEADTQAEYDEAYDKMIRKIFADNGLDYDNEDDQKSTKGQGLISNLEKDLGQDDEYQDFELRRRALDNFEDGSAADEFVQDGGGLDKWLKEHPEYTREEAINLLLQVDPQYMENEAEITTAMDAMQGYLDGNKLIAKYDFMTEAKNGLKETMSSEEWSKWYDTNKELFDPNSDKYIGMDFQKFTGMSHADRQAVLDQQRGSKVEGLDKQIEAQKADVEKYGSEEYRQSYIDQETETQYNQETERVETERNEKRTAVLQSQTSYDWEDAYLDAEYLDEAIEWKNGTMSKDSEEYKKIDEWAKSQGWAGSKEGDYAENYLKHKWEYLNAYAQEYENDTAQTLKDKGYGTENWGIRDANKDEVRDNVTNDYDDKADTAQTNLEALEQQRHLAALEETNAKIAASDLDSEEIYETATAIQEMATSSDELADSLAEDADAAREASVEMARYNKSVEALESGYSDWFDALKSGNVTEQAKAAKELDTVYADMLDLNFGQLSNDFLQCADNLDLAKAAAEGSAEAYNKLQAAAAEDLYTKNLGQMDAVTEALIEEMARIDEIEDIDVGEKITVGQSDVADKLQNIYQDAYTAAINGGKSVAEAKAIANQIMQAEGFNVGEMEWEEKTVYVSSTLPPDQIPMQGKNYSNNDLSAMGVTWKDEPGGEYTYPVTMLVPKGKMSFTKSAESIGGKKAKSSGGGGSKKKAEEVKKSDVVDRYKEVTDSLDDNADAMEKASRAAERLYGKDRINNMREANKLLQKEIDLTKKKRQEAEAYLKEDGDALVTAVAEAGIEFTFDDKGNITNYTEQMTLLYDQLDAAITKANEDGSASESEQEEIDNIQKKIDNVKDALSTYEETRETIEDLDKELEEKFNEWQDNNFEILNAELEIKIELNDMELEKIEYYLSKIEDDFYSMAEAASLMTFDENDGLGGQMGVYLDNLETQKEYIKELEQSFAAGEISETAFVEGLKNVNSVIYENLGNIQALDKEMQEYYSNTLAAASEELSKYTELMEHSASVLDHYKSIAEMLGKSMDYKYMDKILRGQSEVAKQSYEVSKANYEMLKRQEADRKADYDAAVARGAGEKELEGLKENWETARKSANEAQEQMLSDAEAWGEALRAVLDNELSSLGQDLENSLTGAFGSFEAMDTAFERRNSLQEEYLTTTNKIYETNKLMRTAQQEIDKTTNQMAKTKLKQFINETSALQQQGKLSQYELDIQQAKYDLLLAEIALREAQNAKSTVRLRRDSEGNFGYVYTADQNAIADAQQKFEDAENALYNKALEGANNYVQKYQETMAEMQDTLTQMHQDYLDGAYESEEEYNRAVEEAKAYYYQKLTDYSELYQIAISADARAANDSWTKEFANITENTDYYMGEVSKYIGGAKEAIDQWKISMDTINNETLNNMEQAVKDVVTATQDLAKSAKEEVIPELESELTAVGNVTTAYMAYRDSLDQVIGKYETLAEDSQALIIKLSEMESQAKKTAQAINTAYTASPSAGDTGDTSGGDKGGYPGGTAQTKTVTATFNSKSEMKKYNGQDYIKLNDGAGWAAKSKMMAGTLVNSSSRHATYSAKLYLSDIIASLDTGGYTGEWGPYGKMAMLHEKELILNKHDTENFLASMEILHRILEIIDLQSMSSQIGGILSSPAFNGMDSSVIEQNVHIEASFPNATDHNEIEEAFNNLINMSSQYANRK